MEETVYAPRKKENMGLIKHSIYPASICSSVRTDFALYNREDAHSIWRLCLRERILKDSLGQRIWERIMCHVSHAVASFLSPRKVSVKCVSLQSGVV